MKRLILLLASLLVLLSSLNGQNVQLHYDFGETVYEDLALRPKWTTTVEMFRPDDWGSFYFFIDMDYKNEGITSAYWELHRELRFWKAPLSIHLQYDGGLGFSNGHIGVTYTSNNADYTKGYTLTVAAKHYFSDLMKPVGLQLAGTWYFYMDQKRYHFTGFAYLWTQTTRNTLLSNAETDICFAAEPQFWVNLKEFQGVNKKFNLSIGTEWKVTYNFLLADRVAIFPTLAAKWTF